MATKLPESTTAASLTSEPEKLLPCPFCLATPVMGFSIARRSDGNGCLQRVKCLDCGANGPEEHDADEAVAMWNRRLSSPVSGTDMMPEGMKPWNGGDGPPADWDGGPVYRRALGVVAFDEPEDDGFEWEHHPHGRLHDLDIIAYTASPTRPIPVIAEAGEREPDLRTVLTGALYFAVCTLAFHGRDRGTERQERMLDDLEKLARDLDPRIRAVRAALSTPATLDNTAAIKTMRADDIRDAIRAWLDAEDATHWGAFEIALDAAVQGVNEREAAVAMLRADAETMRGNANAYSEEAPSDARALHEVATTLVFKAAQIERGDHLATLTAKTEKAE